jgi:hypothetical protein
MNNRREEREERRRERKEEREQPAAGGGGQLPQMPRELKYAWGVGMTLLLAASLLLDRGSAWMPLVHRAIDLLQQQTIPTGSK